MSQNDHDLYINMSQNDIPLNTIVYYNSIIMEYGNIFMLPFYDDIQFSNIVNDIVYMLVN